jgi:hypothetical protein
MKRGILAVTAMAALAGLPPVAGAQHDHAGDMSIGATADGGGDFLVEYDFTRITRTDFSGIVGPFALYSSSNPGYLAAADEPGEGIWELDTGTTVEMAVVAIGPNLQVQIGASVLDGPGDAATIGTHDGVPGDGGALHGHPTFRLILDAPEGEFGEGTIAFQVRGDPSNPTAYGDSETYTMHVSNGYLPEPAAADPGDGAACQKAVAAQVRAFLGKVYKNLARCLDAVQSFKASGGDLAAPTGGVRNKCSGDPDKGLLAKLAGDRLAALE